MLLGERQLKEHNLLPIAVIESDRGEENELIGVSSAWEQFR